MNLSNNPWVQIEQLEIYNKKLLTENAKYANEMDELAALLQVILDNRTVETDHIFGKEFMLELEKAVTG